VITVLHDVEVDGRLVDVRCDAGAITEIGTGLDRGTDTAIDGHGGALLPGLHDHHIHLFATAALARSVPVGPADVSGKDGLAATLGAAGRGLPPGAWIRATGYHESVAGPLDREVLDALVPDRPLRVQHRTGAMWVLNSAACRAVALDESPPEGAEVDQHGRPTGRLVRLDGWLRDRLPPTGPPDLTALATRLHRLGITGVTDTTATASLDDLCALLPVAQHLHVAATGGPALTDATFPPGIARGPVKVVVDEHDLPPLGGLVAWIRAAHAAGRAVALHLVTRASIVLALAAWDEAGAVPGDRIEHGSVIPAELIAELAHSRLTVVTQPSFVHERGDQYLTDVDPDDLDHLYRCGSLLSAGVAVAAGSDAPYGDVDPWAAMVAAIGRTTRGGVLLGGTERVRALRALELFLGPLDDPGGPPRTVAVGAPADLVLLDAPLDRALADPSADRVAATLVAGSIAWSR
jgi:predicted amidohydrolase YtcJ